MRLPPSWAGSDSHARPSPVLMKQQNAPAGGTQITMRLHMDA